MKSVQLNESTHVPLGWLMTFTGFLIVFGIGGIGWLTTLYADVAQAKRDIVELHESDKEKSRILNKLDRGLMRVQTKMGIRVPDED